MKNNNENIIEVKNLYKKFGKFIAVNDLNFTVRKGEIFGFLGANGAGKTTTIKILCGLSSPTSGDIKVAGFNVYKQVEEIKQSIGYMSQKFTLYEDLTVYENIRFYAGIYGLPRKIIKSKIEELIDKLKMQNFRDKLIQDIPLGWKQKLSFSIAILHNPRIVFLDEPTSGVDPITRRQFWELIYQAAERGVTVFVTTHYMDEAEYCDRILIMTEGRKVALDTPINLMKYYKTDNINDVFIQLVRNIEL